MSCGLLHGWRHHVKLLTSSSWAPVSTARGSQPPGNGVPHEDELALFLGMHVNVCLFSYKYI